MVMRLPIQMPVSSGNPDTDTLKVMLFPAVWHPWAQPDRHIKLAVTHPAPLHILYAQRDHSLVGMSRGVGVSLEEKAEMEMVQWGAVGSQSFHIQLAPKLHFGCHQPLP